MYYIQFMLYFGKYFPIISQLTKFVKLPKIYCQKITDIYIEKTKSKFVTPQFFHFFFTFSVYFTLFDKNCILFIINIYI